jgi:ATP-dependent DNA ligase
MTRDVDVARGWFEEMVSAGIEGLVVKGGSQAYRGGQRDWVKVKHRQTQDVVVGAVIGPRQRPEAVVVGLLEDGELRIAGRSTPLSASASRHLGALLRPPAGWHPWPEIVGSGALDRFNGGREPVALTLVEPVVAEVSADTARVGGKFRHGVRFIRLRSDLESSVEEPDGP